MYIEMLASSMQRNDEQPNIDLAQMLAKDDNAEGVKEIVSGLKMKQATANDCIKVLYETGERKPVLIAPYANAFLELMYSKNNRLVWGAMTALASIADIAADEIFAQIGRVIYAYENGSVITVDNSITVFARVCASKEEYESKLFPLLIKHLSVCRPKEVAQHAERASVCVKINNRDEFISVLEKRKPTLTQAQIKRIDKLISRITTKQ